MGKSQVERNAIKTLKPNILVAIWYGVCLQFALLQFFLLFVNFHILHPWQWLSATFKQFFSWRTFFSIFPVIMAVFLYDVVLYNRLMTKKYYLASRFSRLILPLGPKMLLLLLHTLVGLLSAWLYCSYLPLEYRQFTVQCYDETCLNDRYLFLLSSGIAAGIYHFAKKHANQEPDIEFPIVQQRRIVQIRSSLYSVFYTTLWQTLMPTLVLALVYGLANSIGCNMVANILQLSSVESMGSLWSVITDLHLLFYAWLLQTHIISNFHLLFRFYSIVFSDHLHFPISAKMPGAYVGTEEQDHPVTLAKALSVEETPLVQNLAALQLYKIFIDAGRTNERQEIFELTRVSDHPYNWHQLSVQCLCLITAFTDDLESAVKKISNIKMSPHLLAASYHKSHKAVAQQALYQQRDNGGMRPLWTQPLHNENTANGIGVAKYELPKMRLPKMHELCFRVPFIKYVFGEAETAKTSHLLSNAQYMVWLTQGLAGMCAISLTEDRYGVVQSTLPDTFNALLKLKCEVEKLNNVSLSGKKLDRSLLNLKNAVKRSLYRMCAAFGDYLPDIVADQHVLQQLQPFVNFQEI